MLVRNINGTSDSKKCPCEIWLNHWMRYTKKMPSSCSVPNCENKELVGAHVQKEDADDNSWYIIPLCKEHNNQKGEMLVVRKTELIPAVRRDKCLHVPLGVGIRKPSRQS
jgi:hypothetical protein